MLHKESKQKQTGDEQSGDLIELSLAELAAEVFADRSESLVGP